MYNYKASNRKILGKKEYQMHDEVLDRDDFYNLSAFPSVPKDSAMVVGAKPPANSNIKANKSGDNVREANPERWPTMRGRPEIRSTPTNGQPYYQAKIHRVEKKPGGNEVRKVGKGQGPSKSDAVDHAYEAAGGKPNKNVKAPNL